MKKNKPAHQIRFGSIKASIWENETVNGAWSSGASTPVTCSCR